MSRPTQLRVVLIASLLSLGCGDADKEPVTLYDSLAAAYCDALGSCPNPSAMRRSAARQAGLYPGGCRVWLADVWRRYLPKEHNLEAAIATRRIRLRADQAPACFEELRSSCEGPSAMSLLPACREALEGAVRVGEVCYLDEECAGDAWCAKPWELSAAVPCAGTCQPRVQRGAGCNRDEECSSSLGPTRCGDLPSRCLPLVYRDVEEGRECSTRIVANQIFVTRCPPGTYCGSTQPPGATPSEPTCIPYAAIDEPCGPPQCGLNARCEGAGDGRRCQRADVLYAEGDLCDDQGFGGLAECSIFNDLICADGACRRDGDGQLGSSCRSHLGFFTGVERRPCEPGAFCDGTARDGLCRPQKGLGEMCTSASECAPGGCNGFCIDQPTTTDDYCEW